MARYYFNVCDGVTLPDDEGSEHENMKEVEREALRIMGSLFQVAEYDPARDWRVEVADETGATVVVLRYAFTDQAMGLSQVA